MCKKLPAIIFLLFCFVSISFAAQVRGDWAGTFETDGVLSAMRLTVSEQNDYADSKIVFNLARDESANPIHLWRD